MEGAELQEWRRQHKEKVEAAIRMAGENATIKQIIQELHSRRVLTPKGCNWTEQSFCNYRARWLSKQAA